jgi:anti-sigma B factor antagonist
MEKMHQAQDLFAAPITYVEPTIMTAQRSILIRPVAVSTQTAEIQHIGQDLIAVCDQNREECRVALAGRITIDSSPDLRMFLLEKLGALRCPVFAVDFGEVTYVDTSGLAVLVELLKVARQSAKRLQLWRLREGPRYLLEATRLIHLFEEVNPDVIREKS